jgi:hypothetical protein
MTPKIVARKMFTKMLFELNMSENHADQINDALASRLIDDEHIIAINLAQRATRRKLIDTQFVATSYGAVWYSNGHVWVNWIPPQYNIPIHVWEVCDIRWVFFGAVPGDHEDLTADIVKDRIDDVITLITDSAMTTVQYEWVPAWHTRTRLC